MVHLPFLIPHRHLTGFGTTGSCSKKIFAYNLLFLIIKSYLSVGYFITQCDKYFLLSSTTKISAGILQGGIISSYLIIAMLLVNPPLHTYLVPTALMTKLEYNLQKPSLYYCLSKPQETSVEEFCTIRRLKINRSESAYILQIPSDIYSAVFHYDVQIPMLQTVKYFGLTLVRRLT